MKGPYVIQKSGLRWPSETRGRKKGSTDRNHAERQEAIKLGVSLVASGLNYIAAAKSVRAVYPSVTAKRMARLISQSIKDSHPK